jgi:hypothetical protein
MQVSANDIKCLREHLTKANEILHRLGFGLDGGASEGKAVKKEPTVAQRKKNWAEALETGKKPKHLQK